MRALIDDLATSIAQRNRLTAQLDRAAAAAERGRTARAIRELTDFQQLVRRERRMDSSLRQVLLRDADAMIAQLDEG